MFMLGSSFKSSSSSSSSSSSLSLLVKLFSDSISDHNTWPLLLLFWFVTINYHHYSLAIPTTIHSTSVESASWFTEASLSVNTSDHQLAIQTHSEAWTRLGKIMNHACFGRSNMNECHLSNESDLECIWCEYWCVHRNQSDHYQARTLNNSHDCHQMSHQLKQIFTPPIVDRIQPRVVFTNVATMISIYGSYLDQHSSPYVYNSVTEIAFNNEHVCVIHSRNFSLIRCVLESVNTTHSMKMKLSFTRIVYDLKETIHLETNCSILVRTYNSDDDHIPASNDSFGFFKRFKNVQTLFGLVLGVVVCSMGWIAYVKRAQVNAVYELTKRRFVIKKIKQLLIEKNLYVEYRQVRLKHKLGDGNFGEVYSALLTTSNDEVIEAAVKKLKKGANLAKIKMFTTEGIRMSTFTHHRILSPVAIFIDKSCQVPVIVLPLMINSDLCRYLRQHKLFPLAKLIDFALQIAEGMEYLSSINFIHGDLATRNCLLDENLQVKIGDFGLSRQMYKPDYIVINDIYKPIRWMAIECLTMKKPKFTLKSDVWSYGVVLWEIFTLGSYPYEELDNSAIYKHLKSGYRLGKPSTCPDALFQMMSNCWTVDYSQRPTFVQLRQQLEQFIANYSTDYENSNQRDSIMRDYMNYTSMAQEFVQNYAYDSIYDTNQ